MIYRVTHATVLLWHVLLHGIMCVCSALSEVPQMALYPVGTLLPWPSRLIGGKPGLQQ